jgi:hypothetical protein
VTRAGRGPAYADVPIAHRSFLGVLFFATLPAGAQPCEAPSNVKAAIEAATLQTATFMGHRIAAAKKVREQFPANYFAHRFYQELLVKQGLFSQPVQEEYRALLDAHPDHLTYLAPYPHVEGYQHTRSHQAAGQDPGTPAGRCAGALGSTDRAGTQDDRRFEVTPKAAARNSTALMVHSGEDRRSDRILNDRFCGWDGHAYAG